MCSLFSQGECIEAGGANGSVDPVERLVALGETGTQDNEDADVFQSDNSDEDIDVLLTNEANDDFDDDGQEDPNVGEALHDNPHIPFFTNLVGADDVVGGRDLYDGCPTWSDVTPEFAKGMVFKDKDAVIRACNCHDCPWKLRACLKKQHGFFEIKQYPGPHTCLHGMESLDHRNINSTFIAHLIKTQVAEDPGWKIASIVENVKNHSGFTISYKKAWLGRTKTIAMVKTIIAEHVSGYEDRPEADCRSTTLLQIWACERFRVCARIACDDHTAGTTAFTYRGMHFPGRPWELDGDLDFARPLLPPMSSHGGRYDGIMHELPDYCRVASDIWVSRSPLVCFEVVEWHLPDRVCKQFGLRQDVPVAVDTSPALHAHRPTSGYVEIGSTIEIATRYIAAIHDRIDRAFYSYDRPESLTQDMYDARDMCSRSLHALREHERIGQPEVPEPPLPCHRESQPLSLPCHQHFQSIHLPARLPPSSSRSMSVLPRHLHPTLHLRCHHIRITFLSHDMPHHHVRVVLGDEEEFDGYVDPLLASTGQIEIPVSVEGCQSEKETLVHRLVVRFQATRRLEINPQPSMSCVRTRTQTVTNGMAENVALLTNLSSCTILWVQSATSFIGKASLSPPTGVTDDKCIRFPWEDLFDKRCEQEMYCRWHGLRVPKARSATLFGRGSPNSQVIKALEREIDEMQRRLDRYHFTEYAKKECADPTQRIIEINVDPLLVSDPELSDFSEEEGDDDFVNYLPSSISVAGKPLCCYEHGP
ncbi:hypothetical protein Acr_20g0004240 [Actinidia rufa]|uniref:Aminotransferase-like plant mobile domain-containing protein n=1 Tax=Actinidia rufa TaxID=165716 RepID=A0A7J0GCS0_9ERIC|nr:hypothetical protein Acr_20g0004240 [Actinidia rufa]